MHKPLSFKDSSSRRVFISIVLGVVSMLIFYLFQQYFFVLYKSLISALQYNTEHLISVETVHLIAFVFAGNAVILGNSVAIAFYMSGASKTRKKRFRKRSILNNQSFLIGCYLFWFSEVSSFIGDSSNLLLTYGLLEYAWEVCFLLFIVLFLESVKELRRSFKGYTIKILLLHFLLISALIFACSLLKKSNYNTLGIMYNTSNPYVAIPKFTDAISYDDSVLRSIYSNGCRIPVKILHDSNNVIYKLADNDVSITELVHTPYDCGYQRRSHYDPSFTVYADGTIKYNRLKELEQEAALSGMFVINYAMYAVTVDSHFMYQKILYPPEAVFQDTTRSMPLPLPRTVYSESYLKNKKVHVVPFHTFKTKNQIDQKKVYAYFQESVSDSVFFKFRIDNEITLQQYLDFMISYRQSVYDLRDEQKRMNNDLKDYTINVRKKYPFLFIEEIE